MVIGVIPNPIKGPKRLGGGRTSEGGQLWPLTTFAGETVLRPCRGVFSRGGRGRFELRAVDARAPTQGRASCSHMLLGIQSQSLCFSFRRLTIDLWLNLRHVCMYVFFWQRYSYTRKIVQMGQSYLRMINISYCQWLSAAFATKAQG